MYNAIAEIIGTNEKEDGSNADLCRRAMIESGVPIVRPGTTGADLVDAIQPSHAAHLKSEELQGTIQLIAEREWVMYKPRWGAFYRNHLHSFLKLSW